MRGGEVEALASNFTESASDFKGGRRRRGTKGRRKGKKGTRGRKGPSKWINHVKSYAKQNRMKFGDALRDKKCSQSFKRG